MKGVTYRIIAGDGREYGPASIDELRGWILDGRVGPSTLVWESEDGQWLGAALRPELQWDLPAMEAPPVRSVHEEPRAQLAPFPFRAAAFLFDGMLGLLIVSLVSLPWGREWNELQNAVMETARKPVPDLGIVLRFYAMMVSFHLPVLLLYHVGFNTSFGATPGKLLLGLRIVRCDGSRLTFSRALVRFAAEALSIMPLGAGFLLVLTNPLRQALHDLIADTQVIRLPRPSLVA